MNREMALKEITSRVSNKNLINHMVAVEAIMGGLAEKLGEDKERWMLCGLLHDIDYEETMDAPEKHSILGAKILEELGLDEDIVYAVKVHNEIHGLERRSRMDKALWAADPLSGLITACALVMPDKKLENVTVDSVLKKMKKKDFAKGANREQIKSIEEIGLTLEEFIEIGLESMKKIAQEIGL
ncbi:HDIG domain-containing metalloprotein [Caloramator proteoclasticus]|uniref:HDIG domain-containing protein n=1 Tax=Caloramator proteoclasticus DSM 10124 TaxID=1121262 RepID=A0A1M4ZB60_9CLOT|nr:HDIG domain-containing metalloprotein [Caloramator proteoclasticus]SHF14816.1 HDIG domain-containing protein [Caloramator proteoclasticus DSM 10124]